jgi:hypothetical protein
MKVFTVDCGPHTGRPTRRGEKRSGDRDDLGGVVSAFEANEAEALWEKEEMATTLYKECHSIVTAL